MADYYLIVKTGDAEMRALENTSSSVLDSIVPIVELTRGRKQTLKDENKTIVYPYTKKISRVKEIFRGRKIVMDLTSDEALMSPETDFLYDPSDGYQNWVSFLANLQDEKCFSEIVPSIVISAEDENLERSLAQQADALTKKFPGIAYRSDIFDDYCYDDIKTIVSNLNGKKLYVIIDCSYVCQADVKKYIEKVNSRVSNLIPLLPKNSEVIVSATSFPRNVAEIGDDANDVFKLSEVVLFESLVKEGLYIKYSDYGSINPIRNDNIIMARGWIPRIDIPLPDRVFYYRERRPEKVKDYSSTYTKVANSVLADPNFPNCLDHNWGVRQIRNCAAGMKPSSSPSFWVSVRMCIHIETQVRRLAEFSKKKS